MEDSLLEGLNPQQKQAITAGLGQILVLAGPGSGKTRVLTQRIAYLIGSLGVRPYNILAVTFTNKAAREMEARVGRLLGGAAQGLLLGTFHAVCSRILRREADYLPVQSNFVIFDSDDQEAVVKRAVREMNLNEKLYRPASVHAAISLAKNEMITPETFPVRTHRDEVVARIYKRYQELLIASNAVDFDDLLLYTVQLLAEYQPVREKYARRFEHVLVDEFQDTNQAQYQLLRYLSSYHKNIFVVGDEDQCLPAGTLIRTPQGSKPIETIQAGECVLAAAGRGACMPSLVTHAQGRDHAGDVIRLATRSGHSILATPNHIVFARLGINPGVHYVYLMYRKDRGYRVGVVGGARSNGVDPDLDIGLKVRLDQEHADRVWILRVCDTHEEANYWEQYYAFQYGIPTMVFHETGRRMRFSQQYIERLFTNIDTAERAERLLNDLGMDVRYPHYTPRSKLLRHSINLRYFGDGRRSLATPWNAHRIDIWGSDPKLKDRLEALGYTVRKGKRETWRVGFSRLQFDDAQVLTKELSRISQDLDIVTGAFLTHPGSYPQAQRYSLMPASHLHHSMFVAVERDGEIVEDEIVEVTREHYAGKVYDLEVADVHNYIAEGVVVHNSIYKWRGADYRNVLRFEEDYPQAQKILLEQNYRSTQTVLDAARAVIDQNQNRTRKELFTERGAGSKVILYEANDDYAEAAYVVDTIQQLVDSRTPGGEIAVMYRTNAQSRLLEEAFLRANLPYRLVGAQRFYGRREVKDLIAYLRLVHNPADEVSLARVINVPPRGIGDKTLVALNLAARQAGLSSGELLVELARGPDSPEARPHWETFSGRGAAVLADFGGLLTGWRSVKDETSLPDLFDRILEETGYQAYIDDSSEEGTDRWSNVQELRRIAYEFAERGLADFLENLALVSDQDTLPEAANAPTLLTLHAAKGLEFRHVFITGLDDGILPHSRSFDEPEEMAEERRLFYVGLTRAKDRLYLVRADQRGLHGAPEPAIPSRFIEDIPESLVEGQRRPRRGRFSAVSSRENGRRQPAASYSTWKVPPPPGAKPLPVVERRFKPSTKVRHPSWGEGMVVDSRLQDNDEVVDIFFESVGFKRVVASMAKLEIIR